MNSTMIPLGSGALSGDSTQTARGVETAYILLRFGAALCFVGHGAFGFITKAAWLPYFSVVWIPEAWAWRLMPAVGAVDVLAGMAVLFAPRPLPLLYMTVWALWTALLRPLAGESFFEAIERAGNYGVPFAMLLMTGAPRSMRGLTTLLCGPSQDPRALDLTVRVLKWTTVLLLAGHGVLGAVVEKASLAAHYVAIGLPPSTTQVVGWIELAAATAIAVRPAVGLLIAVAAWKVLSESLFLFAGAPIWELIERSGSYAAPLSLALLLKYRERRAADPG